MFKLVPSQFSRREILELKCCWVLLAISYLRKTETFFTFFFCMYRSILSVFSSFPENRLLVSLEVVFLILLGFLLHGVYCLLCWTKVVLSMTPWRTLCCTHFTLYLLQGFYFDTFGPVLYYVAVNGFVLAEIILDISIVTSLWLFSHCIYYFTNLYYFKGGIEKFKMTIWPAACSLCCE